MRIRYKSQRFASWVLGVDEQEIASYVVPLARHFGSSAVIGPDGRIYLAGRGLELLLKVHFMCAADGLSIDQVDAILDGIGRGRLPGWAASCSGGTAGAGRLEQRVRRLWREDDPCADAATPPGCWHAPYEGSC